MVKTEGLSFVSLAFLGFIIWLLYQWLGTGTDLLADDLIKNVKDLIP